MDKQHELEHLFNAAKNQPAEYSFDEAKQFLLAETNASIAETASEKNQFSHLKTGLSC